MMFQSYPLLRFIRLPLFPDTRCCRAQTPVGCLCSQTGTDNRTMNNRCNIESYKLTFTAVPTRGDKHKCPEPTHMHYKLNVYFWSQNSQRFVWLQDPTLPPEFGIHLSGSYIQQDCNIKLILYAFPDRHWVIELLRLEQTSKVIESSHCPALTSQLPNHVPRYHIYCTSFKYFHRW